MGIENLIRNGHSDLSGLCLASSDWCWEEQAIQREVGMQTSKKPAAALAGRARCGAGGEANG